jgi:hypothetical protein
VRRTLGELAAHLLDVFLVALLDLLAEELLERSIAQPFLALLREVGDDVRDERTRETLGLRVGIVREDWIDRRPRWSRRRDGPGVRRRRR